MSDQRVEDLLDIQNALIHLQLQDKWDCEGETVSIGGAYANIRGRGSQMRSRQPSGCAGSSGDRKSC